MPSLAKAHPKSSPNFPSTPNFPSGGAAAASKLLPTSGASAETNPKGGPALPATHDENNILPAQRVCKFAKAAEDLDDTTAAAEDHDDTAAAAAVRRRSCSTLLKRSFDEVANEGDGACHPFDRAFDRQQELLQQEQLLDQQQVLLMRDLAFHRQQEIRSRDRARKVERDLETNTAAAYALTTERIRRSEDIGFTGSVRPVPTTRFGGTAGWCMQGWPFGLTPPFVQAGGPSNVPGGTALWADNAATSNLGAFNNLLAGTNSGLMGNLVQGVANNGLSGRPSTEVAITTTQASTTIEQIEAELSIARAQLTNYYTTERQNDEEANATATARQNDEEANLASQNNLGANLLTGTFGHIGNGGLLGPSNNLGAFNNLLAGPFGTMNGGVSLASQDITTQLSYTPGNLSALHQRIAEKAARLRVMFNDPMKNKCRCIVKDCQSKAGSPRARFAHCCPEHFKQYIIALRVEAVVVSELTWCQELGGTVSSRTTNTEIVVQLSDDRVIRFGYRTDVWRVRRSSADGSIEGLDIVELDSNLHIGQGTIYSEDIPRVKGIFMDWDRIGGGTGVHMIRLYHGKRPLPTQSELDFVMNALLRSGDDELAELLSDYGRHLILLVNYPKSHRNSGQFHRRLFEYYQTFGSARVVSIKMDIESGSYERENLSSLLQCQVTGMEVKHFEVRTTKNFHITAGSCGCYSGAAAELPRIEWNNAEERAEIIQPEGNHFRCPFHPFGKYTNFADTVGAVGASPCQKYLVASGGRLEVFFSMVTGISRELEELYLRRILDSYEGGPAVPDGVLTRLVQFRPELHFTGADFSTLKRILRYDCRPDRGLTWFARKSVESGSLEIHPSFSRAEVWNSNQRVVLRQTSVISRNEKT